MGFAGQRQRHHGAAVKGVLEGDDAGAPGVRARNLHRILHRFRAAIHKESFLGELSGRDLIHALGQTHVIFVGRHLDAGVKKTIGLGLHRGDHRLATMSHIQASDAAGKIQVAVAVHIFEPGIFRLRYIDRCDNRKAARNGVGTAGSQRFRFRSGNRGS